MLSFKSAKIGTAIAGKCHSSSRLLSTHRCLSSTSFLRSHHIIPSPSFFPKNHNNWSHSIHPTQSIQISLYQFQRILFSSPAAVHSSLGKYNQHPKKWRDPSLRIDDWEEINNDNKLDPAGAAKLAESIADNNNNDNENNETSESDILNILKREKLSKQASRCMDCGTPFCHTSYTGCPLNNLIPEWNALVHTNDNTSWSQALQRLQLTNNFPEFTGRVCPAPCEGACVAGIPTNDLPVSIKDIEYNIIDYGFQNGLIQPRIIPDNKRNGLNVAVIGSGPAGLACADNLNQAGYNVTVYEREDVVGGLLTYGIPNMKLDKQKVKRRIDLLEAEGIKFVTNRHVKSIRTDLDQDNYDAYVLAIGSTVARDLPAPGRNLNGIHFAMEFLTKNQKRLFVSREGTVHSAYDESFFINAKDKNVVVIGGGDTGTDCIGTSMRHQCKSIVNLELMSQPPPERDEISNPWPEWPKVFRIDYGHEEVYTKFGKDPRKYNMSVKEFINDGNGNVKSLKAVNIEFKNGKINEIEGSEIIIDADLVLLAMGFIAPENDIINDLELEIKGNKMNNEYGTNIDNVFIAGDARRGQSLVVWGITEGRQCATAVDKYLVEKTNKLK